MDPFTFVRLLCCFIHPRPNASGRRAIGGHPRRPAGLAITCLLSALIPFVLSAGSTIALADDAWNVDADGVWEDPANWLNGNPPDAIGARAYFGPVITAPRKVIVQDLPGIAGNGDSKVTLGEITINSGIPYSFAATTGLRPLQSIELNNPGSSPVVLRALSDFGHSTHLIGSSETRFNSIDDLVIDAQAFGGVSGNISTTRGRRITKIGQGPHQHILFFRSRISPFLLPARFLRFNGVLDVNAKEFNLSQQRVVFAER